jgi:hypothetical protein
LYDPLPLRAVHPFEFNVCLLSRLVFCSRSGIVSTFPPDQADTFVADCYLLAALDLAPTARSLYSLLVLVGTFLGSELNRPSSGCEFIARAYLYSVPLARELDQYEVATMPRNTASLGALHRPASALRPHHSTILVAPRVPLVVALLILVLAADQAAAATYYVDPQSGSDTATGTSSAAPWQTIPGTRTTDNAAYLRTGWGPGAGTVTQTNKVACGDTILLKGGTTHSTATVPNGGALRIDPHYYTATTCTAANPITVRVATNVQWPGSTGHFTVNGTGMVTTSLANSANSGNGPCNQWGPCALIDIESVNGIIFGGISNAQRVAITAVQKSVADTAAVLVQGKTPYPPPTSKHIQLGWLDITGKTAFDSGYGVQFLDMTLSWVHDVTIHDFLGGGVDTQGCYVAHRARSVVFENVTVRNTGMSTATYSGCQATDFFLGGAEYDDTLAGGGVWCLNCIGANGQVAGHNAWGCNSGGVDGVLRLRDSAFYGNGRNTPIMSQLQSHQGFDMAGDSLDCPFGTGNARPEQTAFVIRSIFYNNRYDGMQTSHGPGSTYVWHSTFYRAGAVSSYRSHDATISKGVYNSIFDPGSLTVPLLNSASTGLPEGINRTVPVFINTLWRGQTGASQLSVPSFFCTSDNGNTFTTTPCSNEAGGMCPSGQTCRQWNRLDRDPKNAFCGTNCPGRSFADPPAPLVGHGNITGTQPTLFASTGGNCNTAFNDGAPGYADCDFHLRAGSPAIDPPAPLYVLRANGAGAGASTITVKAGTPEPEQVANPPLSNSNYGTITGGMNWGARPHVADPRMYFLSPQAHPWATGDVIQVVGTCENGVARHGGAGRARITAMTSSTITLDDRCTWADNAGVHWPWSGTAPDMGAYEFGLGGGTGPPVLLSVEPVL